MLRQSGDQIHDVFAGRHDDLAKAGPFIRQAPNLQADQRRRRHPLI
jgi:ribosomal protein S30